MVAGRRPDGAVLLNRIEFIHAAPELQPRHAF